MQNHRNNANRQYWGKAAAGAILYCVSTGRILLGKRAYWVNEPNTWGGFGGAVDPGESPETGMLREVREETGLNEHSIAETRLLWVFADGAFRYYNFLCFVHEEFTPRLSSETSEAIWCTLDDLPKPLHFGFKALLPHLREALLELDARENPAAFDFHAAIREMEERHAAVVAAHDAGITEFKHKTRETFSVVGVDPSKPDRYRITRYDVDGLSGHSEHPTLADALKHLALERYTQPAPGSFDRIVIASFDARENPPTDAVFFASTNDDDPEFEHHAHEAYNLFQASGLYLHSNYADFLVMTEDGDPESRVIAAAAMSISDGGESQDVEFSVAVDARYKRQGLAKRLVEEVEGYARSLAGEFDWENPMVEAYVVNQEAMVPLLTSMGYSPPAVSRGYWTKSVARRNAGASHIPERPFSDFEGQIVACGYNLNQCSPSKPQRKGEHCWAVRVLDVDSPEDITPSKAKSTRVSAYTEGVFLKDCVFIVHEPTLRAVQNRGSKEVFAFVVGVAVNPRKAASLDADWQTVGFSPLLPPKGRGEGEFMLVSGKTRKSIKRARLFYGKDRQALVSK
jgi:8-oxo-dGTP pyrophosphatase MutT (NUDIX family)/GNAT superfamily N-acetyltransferase